ncbi:MAG: ketopantoate reductase family protein [Bacteriovoracaceae bacterium]|nr:ketopantoate reductase family protein [Bacteriovoracaceae bacterium]
MSSNERPIGFIGAGVVGSIFASALSKNTDRDIVVVDNGPRFEQIKSGGLKTKGVLELDGGTPKLFNSLDAFSEFNLHSLFISTKSSSLKFLLPALKDKVKKDTILISLQNGLETEDTIKEYFPDNPIGRVVINLAGRVDEQSGEIEVAWFNPPNYIGLLDDANETRLGSILEDLNSNGLTTKFVSSFEIKKQSFHKNMLNASLNPMCGLLSLTMNDAMTFDASRSIARGLLKEGLAVGKELGFDYGEGILEKLLAYLDGGGNHYPSMWSDLQAGRMSEIEYINGKIVENAKRLGVETPYNELLTMMVMACESKAGSRKA